MFKSFSRRKKAENWTVVYSTGDLWEAEVIRSALLGENIRANVKSVKGEGRKSVQNVVSVPALKVTEAQMVIHRTSIVISKKEEILAEQEEREKSASEVTFEDHPQAEETATPEMELTSEPIALAEKDDVGRIIYYETEGKYELRLDMENYKTSHFMDAEEWEEFIDFSAQRQEFFILLKEKYPKLAAYLKENKMRPNFLKLIEYSYGKSQPPKKKQSDA